ncbi:hypothetical protein [Bartonella sp. C271]|uniref:hypothetical protein n=1 Tax=Bartonella sp. C271 TaxID=3070220 RepID=UPI0038B5C62A
MDRPWSIRNRIAKEIAESQAIKLSDLKACQARNPNLDDKEKATYFVRSAGKRDKNWLIIINLCTYLSCVTVG